MIVASDVTRKLNQYLQQMSHTDESFWSSIAGDPKRLSLFLLISFIDCMYRNVFAFVIIGSVRIRIRDVPNRFSKYENKILKI